MVIGGAVLLALLAGAYLLGSERAAREIAPARDLERAPQFVWRDLADQERLIYLEDLRGKVVLLNFWSEWCVFCVWEMPILEKLSRDLRDRGLVVIGIHRSDTEPISTGLGVVRERGLTYQMVDDGARGNTFAYLSRGSQLMPLSALIDREGYIREIIFGPREEEQWKAILEPLL